MAAVAKDPSPPVPFEEEYLTAVHGSIAMAAADFARAWAKQWQLKNRVPAEVELRLTFTTGDTLKLHFLGRTIIDGLLEGDYRPLERAIKRAGLPGSDQVPAWDGGPVLGIQIAVPSLYGVGKEAYEAGLRSRPKSYYPYTNRSQVEDFRATSRIMAERRAAEAPVEAFEQARRLAAETGEPVTTGRSVRGGSSSSGRGS